MDDTDELENESLIYARLSKLGQMKDLGRSRACLSVVWANREPVVTNGTDREHWTVKGNGRLRLRTKLE